MRYYIEKSKELSALTIAETNSLNDAIKILQSCRVVEKGYNFTLYALDDDATKNGIIVYEKIDL